MKLNTLIASTLALGAFVAAAPAAEAHYPSAFTAQSTLYADYNHHCGGGTFDLWRCSNRKSDLLSTTDKSGHARHTLYCFIQIRPGRWEKKCVRATIDHDGLYIRSSYNHGLRVESSS